MPISRRRQPKPPETVFLLTRLLYPAVLTKCLLHDLPTKVFFQSLSVFWKLQPARLEMLEKVENSQLKSVPIINFPASWISTAEQIFCGTPPSGAPAMVFHFAQAKQKWKFYRDQGRLTFFVPRHQTPPEGSLLLFLKFALCRSHVCSRMWACLQASRQGAPGRWATLSSM